MNKIAILFLQVLFLVSYNSFTQKPANSERQREADVLISEDEKNGLEISSELLGQIQSITKKKIQPLKREVWKYDRDGNEESYIIDKGIYFDFVDERTAHDIFKTYSNQIKSNGNYLFLTKMDFDDSNHTYYDIVILKCENQFDLIKLIGSNGINYDVYTDEIIQKLRNWNDEVGFEIVVVDEARIHAYMKNLPSDINVFAKDVYEFCPDVIDQGYSSMEEMITDYQTNKYFWLWWD